MIDNNNVKESLKIKLDGDWKLIDLELFLNKINNLYITFYALSDLEKSFKKYFENLDFNHPFFHELRYLYKDLLRYYQESKINKQISNIPGLWPFTQDYSRIIDGILKNEWYIKNKQQLKIIRIHISSPGDIIIEGSGIIKEVRELIKDLKYRNRQEQKIGDLEILQRKINILKSLGIPENEI